MNPPSPASRGIRLVLFRRGTLDLRRFLIGLFLAALGLRLLYLHEISGQPFFRQLIIDQAAYDQWAQAAARGEAPKAVFYQDPLYPYFLALIYAIFGRRLWLVYVIQIAISSSAVFLLYGIGRRVFGEARAGLFAAFLWAVCQVDFFYAGQVDKTSPGVVLSILALWLILVLQDRPWLRVAALAGLTTGLLPLYRGNFLAVVPFLAAWLAVALYRRNGRAALPAFICFLLACLAPTFITALRNRLAGGEWVLTTAQAGQNFYLGNFRGNTWGTGQDPDFVRRTPEFEQADFAREARRRTGQELTAAQLSRFWFREGIKEIAADPALSFRREMRKFLLLLNRHELSDNLNYDFFRLYFSRILRLPLPGPWLTITLGLGGIALALRRRQAGLLLLYLASYSATLLIFYVLGRYRMPLLPVLMIFAGAGVSAAGEAVKGREWSSVVLYLATVTAAGVLSAPSWLSPQFDVAWYKLGNSYAREARWEEAISAYEEAIRHNPRRVESWLGLGLTLTERNRWTEAQAAFGHAVQVNPAHAPAHYLLGLSFLRAGEKDEAEREFREALRQDPFLEEAKTALEKL